MQNLDSNLISGNGWCFIGKINGRRSTNDSQILWIRNCIAASLRDAPHTKALLHKPHIFLSHGHYAQIPTLDKMWSFAAHDRMLAQLAFHSQRKSIKKRMETGCRNYSDSQGNSGIIMRLSPNQHQIDFEQIPPSQTLIIGRSHQQNWSMPW